MNYSYFYLVKYLHLLGGQHEREGNWTKIKSHIKDWTDGGWLRRLGSETHQRMAMWREIRTDKERERICEIKYHEVAALWAEYATSVILPELEAKTRMQSFFFPDK